MNNNFYNTNINNTNTQTFVILLKWQNINLKRLIRIIKRIKTI